MSEREMPEPLAPLTAVAINELLKKTTAEQAVEIMAIYAAANALDQYLSLKVSIGSLDFQDDISEFAPALALRHLTEELVGMQGLIA